MDSKRVSINAACMVAAAMLVTLPVSTAPLFAQQAEQAGPGDGPGWTGVTHPAEMINARQLLMFALEDLMRPIDTYTVDATIEPEELTDHATTIAAMLQATPHLFPPTTDLYDPDAEYPATLALPRIWEEFAAFHALADVAANAALTLAEASSGEELRGGALALRASCDACHGAYLKPYERGGVSEEDRNFDFDSIFDN